MAPSSRICLSRDTFARSQSLLTSAKCDHYERHQYSIGVFEDTVKNYSLVDIFDINQDALDSNRSLGTFNRFFHWFFRYKHWKLYYFKCSSRYFIPITFKFKTIGSFLLKHSIERIRLNFQKHFSTLAALLRANIPRIIYTECGLSNFVRIDIENFYIATLYFGLATVKWITFVYSVYKILL